MPFPFFKKIFSLFHRRTDDKKMQTSSADPEGGTDPKEDDSPPPYVHSSSPAVGESIDCNKSSSSLPASRCLQICTHDTLTFDRLQRITNLPNFHKAGKRIDALTSVSDDHFRSTGITVEVGADQMYCKPLGKLHDSDLFSSLSGYGSFYHRKQCSGAASGLLLSFHWYMSIGSGTKEKCRSAEAIKVFLETANVNLCEHKRLADPQIVDLLFGIANSNAKLADPIDRYIAKEVGIKCDYCDTKITVSKASKEKKGCHVHVERFLGNGESAKNPVWLSQCGA